MRYQTIVKIGVACLAMVTASSSLAALPISGRILDVSGTEEISRPYRFEVTIIGQAPDGSLADLIGTQASFALPGGRRVAGVIDEVRALGATGEGMRYRLAIVPRLKDFAYNHRYRTFNDATSVEIIEFLLGEMGLSAEISLQGDYRTHPHVTQYNESDLEFLHRLLEAEGIYYYFQHSANTSQLMLSDDSSSALLLRPLLQMTGRSPNVLDFDFGFAKHPGTIRLHGSSFETPNAALTIDASTSRYAALVDEHHGARHTSPGEGSADANVQLQATIAKALEIRGTSSLSALVPGSFVRLAGHPQPEANQTYFITSVRHTVSADGVYSNEFTAVPSGVRYRSVAATPEPVAAPVFAFVAGPAGEEIHVDEFGRVKVSLPWISNVGSEPWVRVLQPNPDSLWLPRIGDEVLVAFEHGDPARPYVAGTAFNGQSYPPYALPDQKDVRRLGSKSTPGGEATNELMFGDRAELEVIRINAARDFETTTPNDQRVTVGNAQLTQVARDRRISVGGDQETDIGGDSMTRADTLILQGKDRIILQVGDQRLVIDAKGVTWTGMSQATASTSNSTTDKVATPTKSPTITKEPLKRR